MQEIDYYNSYNARHLKPSEVAERFIVSKSFEKLIENNHSVILGARGCGKTTLMKMLTLPALYNWENSIGIKLRTSLPFYAIYISTDIYWDVKNRSYHLELESFGNFADKISHFTVTSNIFISLCDTFKNIIDFEFSNDDESKEILLCKSIIKAWKLESVVPKLDYIREALYERIDLVNQFIQDVVFNYSDEKEIETPSFFNLSFETSLEYVIPIFERIYSIQNKKKWALCFDELEFAPTWLQEKLFGSLRSRTQFLLYKLSSSPLLPSELKKVFTNNYSGTVGNDVDIIKMWSASDSEKFSKEIIESLLNQKVKSVDVKSFFGSNPIYNKDSNSYVEGGDFYKEIQELIIKDDAFKEFLISKKVDIERPLPVQNEKDVLYRKIKPTVIYRNYYLSSNKKINSNGFKTTLRSRKTSELFSGLEVLIKICDGNPRWLISIVNSIISNSNGISASKTEQFSEIYSSCKRFENVIANIPTGNKISVSLNEIIQRIGEYFKNQILGKDFYLDPKGTFVVDENSSDISDDLVALLEKGLSQGAFILLDSDETAFDFRLRGKRLKLSYMYSPLYSLPLRKYPAVKLSDCLKGLETDITRQISLF